MDTQPRLRIRRARPADLPAVLALYRELGDDAPVSLRRARFLLRRIAAYPDHGVFVAVAGRAIVGTFALLVMDNLAHRGAPSGVVEDVAVRRDWQRRGVGRRMMRAAWAHCRARGCYKLTLSSNSRRVVAHRFYVALGFRRHGYSFRIDPGPAAGPTAGGRRARSRLSRPST